MPTAVKKWDKEFVVGRFGETLPMCPYWRGRFSKTGTGVKLMKLKQMGEISTFQARTTTATGIFLLYL
jgi:hypothetical protein